MKGAVDFYFWGGDVGTTVVCDGCVSAVVELQRGADECMCIAYFHTVYLQHSVFCVVLYLYCELPFFEVFSFCCVVFLLVYSLFYFFYYGCHYTGLQEHTG